MQRLTKYLPKTAGGIALAALAAAIIGIMLFAPKPAQAADKGGPAAQIVPDTPVPVRTWTGVYVSVGGGYGVSTTEISVAKGSLDGISAHGTFYGAALGADYQFAHSALVLRGRGGYEWSNIEFNISPIFTAGFDKGWYGDVGLGWAMGSAMPYAMLGWTEMETAASYKGTAIPGTPTLQGVRYTGGVEWRLPKTFDAALQPTLAGEITYTDYKDQTYGTGLKAVTFAPDDFKAMIRLNLGFKALGK